MVAGSSAPPPPTQIDIARERELFRYFRPPDDQPISPKTTRHETSVLPKDDLNVNAPSSPEASLTALAQLCAIRLNASRAMVSVIGKETQYFIAEATKSLDLNDTRKSETENDGLWVGCGSVGKEGRLCEMTIELPVIPGKCQCFTVTDLSKDERFNRLPFVAGPPAFRFYAGTPLITKKGINIGTLFVLDDKPRPELRPDQEEILCTIAGIIMRHMEASREAEQRKSLLRMSKALNAFVEGKGRFNASDEQSENHPTSPVEENPDNTNTPHYNIESAHKATFKRAANLLNDSLNEDGNGGVCFFDTLTTLKHGPANRGDNDREDETTSAESESDISEPKDPAHSRPKAGNSMLANIMSSSGCEPVTFVTKKRLDSNKFRPLSMDFLQGLLKQHPRGKLWVFDGADGLTSSEEEDPTSPNPATQSARAHGRAARREYELENFRMHFPDVRELLFVPLWDTASARWLSGCICWRFAHRTIFSTETELQFVTAFANSIVAETSRLHSIFESKQKGDFIGSISHELRSPLHGILASAEFLSETDFDTFQSSLVDTISSCGRTLLDTIEHILDFSKINSFEKNWLNARKPKVGARGSRSLIKAAAKRSIAKEAPPMMSIFAVTEVAAIIEEVVEGVYAGQVYRDFGSGGFTDAAASRKGSSQDQHLTYGERPGIAGADKLGTQKDVEVILDISKENYCFTTQPGALRRVVMNILGNSLKYTVFGRITVKVRLRPVEDPDDGKKDARILEVTVTDTGKGISSDYLRSRLFTPFSQEDVLASGTGLGLSIVRSIITMLEGSIDIQSQAGHGTEVRIEVPLLREPLGATPVSTPSSVGSPDKLQDNSISTLQTDYPTKTVSLFVDRLDIEGTTALSETCRVAMSYIENWYKLPVKSWLGEPSADIVIVEELCLASLLKQIDHQPAIVVLCNTTHRLQAAESLYRGAIEFISTPFGPYRLAKAVRIVLEKAKRITDGTTSIMGSTSHSSRSSEVGTVVPEFDSMTLQSESEETPIRVQTNGVVTASHSSNARMALGSDSSGGSSEIRDDFPFPVQESPSSDSPPLQRPFGDLTRQASSRPRLISRRTEPAFRPPFPYSSAFTQQGALAVSDARGVDPALLSPRQPQVAQREVAKELSSPEPPSASKERDQGKERPRPPRILLVDDNQINLRLLKTFMSKRKYQYVESAENGQLALEAAKNHNFDIIFMDLSMPIMNGIESTRAIRELEQTRTADEYLEKPKPAMIIALTGLASSRDQGEAFTAGVDLYMTKPVSFKEVGRLLDNWEAHGGVDAQIESIKGKS